MIKLNQNEFNICNKLNEWLIGNLENTANIFMV